MYDTMKARCVIVTLASQIIYCKYQTKLSQIRPNFRFELVVLFIGGGAVCLNYQRLFRKALRDVGPLPARPDWRV